METNASNTYAMHMGPVQVAAAMRRASATRLLITRIHDDCRRLYHRPLLCNVPFKLPVAARGVLTQCADTEYTWVVIKGDVRRHQTIRTAVTVFYDAPMQSMVIRRSAYTGHYNSMTYLHARIVSRAGTDVLVPSKLYASHWMDGCSDASVFADAYLSIRF